MARFLRIFLLCTLSLLAAASLAGLALWKTEGLRFYSVQTASMAPLLQPGDLTITLKPDPKKLQPGDIISYASPQNPTLIITHRIYRLEPAKGYIVTKGDNLGYPDPPAGYASVTGRAVKAIPKAGYFLDFLHKPAGLISLVYLPALLISALELSRLMQYYSQRGYGLETGAVAKITPFK